MISRAFAELEIFYASISHNRDRRDAIVMFHATFTTRILILGNTVSLDTHCLLKARLCDHFVFASYAARMFNSKHVSRIRSPRDVSRAKTKEKSLLKSRVTRKRTISRVLARFVPVLPACSLFAGMTFILIGLS